MFPRILITAALPYANGPLHFGHIAGAYLPADAYARYQRLKGREVLFVCGSDEYGIAITLSAELAQRTPKEHVDYFHEINFKLFNKLNLSFDHYSRTTWEGHTLTVHEFFQELCDNGYIEERTEEHLYSEKEKRFLADRYVIGQCPKCNFEKARGDECQKCGAHYEASELKNPLSRLTGSPLVLKLSKHWYLRLDKFSDRLEKWIEKKKWKENVVNFAKNYIKELKPRSITRDSTWGVPVPLPTAEGKVFYVWFDAPIGYISATKEWAEKQNNPNLWEKYWMNSKTRLVQFIGKDNIPFHALFFPAIIMGQSKKYKLPDELPANEFLMLEGRQFSKSENWFIDFDEFFQNYTPDQIRYCLAANAPETSDSEFTWKDFQMRCNVELLGKLGNFIHRTLIFAKNNCSLRVPPKKNLKDIDNNFLKQVDTIVREIGGCYEKFHLRRASGLIIKLAHEGNVYFDAKGPWKGVKDSSLREDMENTISCCLECIKRIALVSSPIIPQTAQKIWEFLGFTSQLSLQNWDDVGKKMMVEGGTLLEPKVLFRKIENEEIEKEISKLQGKVEKIAKNGQISIEDFEKLDMRVGEILEAEKIAKSEKLIRLRVDVGFEKREIVSGIANFYDPKELIGKRVIVVVNLKPIKLMGITSHGMILAAEDERVELATVQTSKPGSKIS